MPSGARCTISSSRPFTGDRYVMDPAARSVPGLTSSTTRFPRSTVHARSGSSSRGPHTAVRPAAHTATRTPIASRCHVLDMTGPYQMSRRTSRVPTVARRVSRATARSASTASRRLVAFSSPACALTTSRLFERPRWKRSEASSTLPLCKLHAHAGAPEPVLQPLLQTNRAPRLLGDSTPQGVAGPGAPAPLDHRGPDPGGLGGAIQRRRRRKERDRLEPVHTERVPQVVRRLAPRQGHADVELRQELVPRESHVALGFVDRRIGIAQLAAVLQRQRHRQRRRHRRDPPVHLRDNAKLVVGVPRHQEPQLVLQVLDRTLDVEELTLRLRHELPRPEHVQLRHEVRAQLRLRGGEQAPGVVHRGPRGDRELLLGNQPVVGAGDVDGELLFRKDVLALGASDLILRSFDLPAADRRPEASKQRLAHEQGRICGVEAANLVAERRRPHVHPDFRPGRKPPRRPDPVGSGCERRTVRGPEQVRRDPRRESGRRNRPAEPRLLDALARCRHPVVARQGGPNRLGERQQRRGILDPDIGRRQEQQRRNHQDPHGRSLSFRRRHFTAFPASRKSAPLAWEPRRLPQARTAL